MLQNVDQIAQRLAVSVPTVWRYAREQADFPKPLRLSPGCSRWRTEEIDHWLETRERATIA